MGSGVKSETVKAAVGACLQIGLFDSRYVRPSKRVCSRRLNAVSIMRLLFRADDDLHMAWHRLSHPVDEIALVAGGVGQVGDTKIDRLLEAQGWIGFSVYFYLCQMAYKFDGYFYRWSYADATRLLPQIVESVQVLGKPLSPDRFGYQDGEVRLGRACRLDSLIRGCLRRTPS